MDGMPLSDRFTPRCVHPCHVVILSCWLLTGSANSTCVELVCGYQHAFSSITTGPHHHAAPTSLCVLILS